MLVNDLISEELCRREAGPVCSALRRRAREIQTKPTPEPQPDQAHRWWLSGFDWGL